MTVLATLVRFFHLGAEALLLGALGFLVLVARPAWRVAGAKGLTALKDFERNLLTLAWWALLIVLLSGLLGFWVQVAAITSRPLLKALSFDAMAGVFMGTRYGLVALIRLLILTFLAAAILLQRQKESTPLRLVGVVLAACLMMALAFSGHAAAGEGTALLLQLTVDSLHLLAAGFWVGGLIPLALLLHRAWRSDEPAARTAAREAVRRFSLLGLVSVSILIVTGFLNTRNLVGGVAQLVGTAYGRLLIIKLSLLLPLIVIAAVNLLGLKPKLLAAAPSDASGTFKTLLGALQGNVLAEALLGTVILLLVGGMSVTPPGRHIQPEWPFSFRWYWNVTKGSQKIRSQVITGSAIAVLGLLALSTALLRRRERHWTLSIGLTGIGYGAIIALPALSIDAYPTTYRRPAVAYHAISVANGSRLYLESCALCHGVSGFGDGPAGKGLKPKPADLTAKHTGDHTAGDLFWWLTHGVNGTAMPGFKDSLTEEERWDLINFMRTLASAEQARSMAALVEPDPWLVAPDFVYRTANAEGKTLKEHRDEKIVLLVLFSLPYSQVRLEQLDQLYGKLMSAGVEVLAVPRETPFSSSHIGKAFRSLPVVTDGGQETFETYTLFRRSLSEEGTLPDPPIPRHMEFLIDRQGYVRARWIPGEGTGWGSTKILIREIDRLKNEKSTAPAPDEHVH